MTVFGEIITSKQNRVVVEVGKLSDRKARTAEKLFRFDGIKLFREAVANGIIIQKILLDEERSARILPELYGCSDAPALANATVYLLSKDAFLKVSREQAPEGILTVAAFPQIHAREESTSHLRERLARDPRGVLLLESVRDPGNLGTILRSAAAFGISCVAISADCADVYNEKTVRGAMGALFRMPILEFSDIKEAIDLLRSEGRRVFAAALDPTAARLEKSLLKREDCVVIGNEGHGLSAETIAACDRSLYIPMEAGSESLNAAIAASVILWSMYEN